MRIRALAAPGLVLLALSATACSGGSGSGGSGSTRSAASGSGGSTTGTTQASSPSGASVNVCSLMTAKRASAITGVTYSKAASSRNMCNYTPTNAPIGMFIIIFPNSKGTAAWKSEVSTLEEDGSGPPIKLSGFSGPAAGDGEEIGVQVGSDIIDIHGGDPSSTGSAFPKSVALARAIASQLH